MPIAFAFLTYVTLMADAFPPGTKRRARIAFVVSFVLLTSTLAIGDRRFFILGNEFYVGKNGSPHWYWELLARVLVLLVFAAMSLLAAAIAAGVKPTPPVVEPLHLSEVISPPVHTEPH